MDSKQLNALLGGMSTEGLAGGNAAATALAGAQLDALAAAGLAGHSNALAELQAQALLAGLPSSLQQMVPPIAPLQTEAQTIDALQQAILATINTSSNSGMPNLFAALHTLGAEQVPGMGAAVAAAAAGGSGAGAGHKDDSQPPQSTRSKSRRQTSDLDGDDDENRSLASTREKNRLAQRRFREKQKATISEQRDRLEQMGRQLEDYKREVQLLREENNILRAKLEGRATLHQHMMANAPM